MDTRSTILSPIPDYFERVYKGSLRHFRRDSFYSHAVSTLKRSRKHSVVSVDSARDWMLTFFENPTMFAGKDFLLEQVKIREGLNTGYSSSRTNKHSSVDKGRS